MGTYKHRQFIIAVCLLSICMLPLLSACATAFQRIDTQINHIVLLNDKDEAIGTINETGNYMISVASAQGEPEIYYRYDDRLEQLEGTWDEEQNQWLAEADFSAGSYQIIVKWFNEEQLVDEWESNIYQFVDIESLLHQEFQENQSLYLQLTEEQSLDIIVELKEADRGEILSVDKETLYQGYLLEQEGEWELTICITNDTGDTLTKKQAETIVIDRTSPQLSVSALNQDITEDTLPFQAQPLTVVLTASDTHIDEASLLVKVNDLPYAATWSNENDSLQTKLELVKDGTYRIELYAKDSLQNEANIISTPIVIDQSDPKIHLYLDDKEITALPKYINHDAVLKCVIEDDNFDHENSFLTDGEKRYDSWQLNDDLWSLEILLTQGAHEIHIEAFDLLQHHSVLNEHTVIDSIKPIVFITYEALSSYQKDMTISFTIKDENIKADASVLQILYNDELLQAPIKWEEYPEGMKGSVQISAEGSYQFSFQLSDLAGNSAVYSYQNKQTDSFTHTFLLDKTAPVIDAVLSQPNMTANNQTLRIIVQDDYLTKDSIQLNVTKDDKKYSFADAWQSTQGAMSGSYEFTQEGSYTLTVQAVDRAGNKSTVKSLEFIIDKQAPLISIKRSAQMYYAKPTELTIEVSDAYLTQYEIKVLQDHKELTSYNGKADVNQKITVDQDGEYEILVFGRDSAGNKREQRDYFIVDQTAPKLITEFNELPALSKDRFITNQNVVLYMKCEDRYLKEAQIEITKNGKPLSVGFQNHTLSYEFKAEKNREDTYEIHVYLSDEAGNHQEASYELIMDTYIPPLRFADDPFQGKARNISWTPHLILENEAFQISDVILYRNQQMVPSYHWGDAIDGDGHYVLSIRIRDEAMNEAALIPPFTFTIDTTPPVIEILEEQRKAELLNQNVSVDTVLRLYISDSLSENIHIHSLMIGDEKLSFDSRKQDENGVWYYPISFSKVGDIPLFIDVSDEAGNHNKRLITYHVLPHLSKEQVKTVEKKNTVSSVESKANDYRAAWILGAMASVLLLGIVRKLYAEKH